MALKYAFIGMNDLSTLLFFDGMFDPQPIGSSQLKVNSLFFCSMLTYYSILIPYYIEHVYKLVILRSMKIKYNGYLQEFLFAVGIEWAIGTALHEYDCWCLTIVGMEHYFSKYLAKIHVKIITCFNLFSTR